MSKKDHWGKVYQTKKLEEVSWYQSTPETSLAFIREFNPAGPVSIIDIGGGNSLLVDHLLALGYTDITVLDISETALNGAKLRLGEKADRVTWILGDVLDLDTGRQYDCWHDRAVFHFLTTPDQIERYTRLAAKHLNHTGKLIMGTFSTGGPEKCSGLPVKQYDENLIGSVLRKCFAKLKCITTDHITPFDTIQNFLFCCLKKLSY